MAYEEARAYVARVAAELDLDPPSDEDFDTILEVAGVAAHDSARQAAPVTCWLVAAAGLSPTEAHDLVEGLAGSG